MKRIFAIALSLLPLMAIAQVELSSLRVNRLDAPMGVSPEEPVVFSWIATSQEKGAGKYRFAVK